VPQPQPATNSPPQPAASPRRHALPPTLLQPIGRFSGRIHYDALVNGHTRIMPTWLLTTSYPDVATRIATLFSREPQVDGNGSERLYQVLTDHAELDVLLDGPQAIQVRMVRRHGSTLMRCCNGRTQRTAFGKQPCQCPPTVKGRWQAAKAGHGCEPLVQVAFQLAADPTVGRFLLASATWPFADHATSVRATLRQQQHRPVCARLSIDRTLQTTSCGTTFAYSRPTISLLPRP
jgi:hypothetical protein